MNATSPTAPAMLDAQKSTAKALDMRMQGLTYAQIGEALGMSDAGAFQAVKRGLERLKKECDEKAEEVRDIEGQRLDRMLASVWSQVLAGNHGAVDRALRIMDRRAKLYGLDAPQKSQIDHLVCARIEIVADGVVETL